MEKVILETKHESGQVFRLCQLYNDEGNENGFSVLRGEYIGQEGRFRELAKWQRIEKALEHYNDTIFRFLTGTKKQGV